MYNDIALPMKKRSVWPVFFLILFSSTVFVIFLVFNSYNSMLDSIVSIQKSRVLLLSNEIKNKLKNYENYIEISSKALEYDVSNRKSGDLEKKISYLVDINESVFSFAVYSISGNQVLTSGNTNLQLSPDITELTLLGSNLILGRSHFKPELGLVMPLYKPMQFRNETFIVSMVVSVESIFDSPNDIYNVEGIDSLIIWRDIDRYFQFVGPNNIENQIYDAPVEDSLVKSQLARLEKQTGKSIDTLKLEGLPIVNSINGSLRESFTTSVFISDYKIWLTLESNEKQFNKRFVSITLRYLYLYAFFILILTFIFVNIRVRTTEYEKKAKYLIEHDYLTGMKNALYFNQFLTDKVESKQKVNVALFYIENLSTINGLFGHSVGDQLVLKVADILSTYDNKKDTIAVRVGGNEFAIYSNASSLDTISSEVSLLLSKPIKCENHYILVDIRVGLFFCDSNIGSLSEIKRNTNLALDEAKKHSLKVCRYESHLLDEFIRTTTLKEELQNALERQELYVCYQPKVNLNGEVYSLEALLRWNSAKLGHIPPDVFIPLAESTGIIHDFGDFVLDTVIKDRNKLSDIYSFSPNVALNVSLLQMLEESFISNLRNITEIHEIEPGSLTIELTESILMNNIEKIIQVMEEIRALGIKVSLDDFGSGFSSLNLLARLPIDEVKLDRVFICNMDGSESENILLTIKNIISLCLDLSLEVVVEGIEDQDTETVLKKLGAQNFQGYYYSKPMKISDLEMSV